MSDLELSGLNITGKKLGWLCKSQESGRLIWDRVSPGLEPVTFLVWRRLDRKADALTHLATQSRMSMV